MNQTNLLNEFIDQGYDLEKLKLYEDFLIECSEKDYDGMEVHSHHILPRFMKGSNAQENLIVLSFGDHFFAHLKLAECFENKTKERIGNVSSCNKILSVAKLWLQKKDVEISIDIVEFWDVANKLTKGMFAGENNWMFGRKLKRSPEHIKKWQTGSLKWKKEHFKWPEGYFPCDEIIDGSKKRSYQICSGCENKIYSTKRPNTFKPLIDKFCHECLIKQRKEKVQKVISDIKENDEFKFAKNIHSKSVLNVQTGEIYLSIGDAYFQTGLNEYFFNKEKAKGNFIILGKTNTTENLENLPSEFVEINTRFTLPDGIFDCYEIVSDHQKSYYRICPNENCERKIYSTSKSKIIRDFNKSKICASCAKKGFNHSEETKIKLSKSKLGKKVLNYSGDHSGDKNSNCNLIQHIESGKIYKSMKSVLLEFGWSEYEFKKKVKLGEYLILGKSNHKNSELNLQ